MESLIGGVPLLLTFKGISILLLGLIAGLVFRSLPKLGAAAALVLMIPVSTALSATDGMILAGGTLGAVAFGDGMAGVFAAMASLPVLIMAALFAKWAALTFGPSALVLLAVLAVTTTALYRGEFFLRGLFAGVLGFLFAVAGDGGTAQGVMPAGIGLVPSLIGLLVIAPLILLTVRGNTAFDDAARSAATGPGIFVEGLGLARGGEAPGLIALLALGVPAGAATAALFGYFQWSGFGPALAVGKAGGLSALMLALAGGGAIAALIGYCPYRPETLLRRLDIHFAVPLLMALALAATYVSGGGAGGMVVAVAFGILGYFMIKRHYSIATMAIALVLGNPAADSYHRAVEQLGGDMTALPSSSMLPVITLLIVVTLAAAAFNSRRQVGDGPVVVEAQPGPAKLEYAACIWACIAWLLVLVFGFLAALPVYVFGYVHLRGRRPVIAGCVAALAVTLIVWAGFELVLGQPLYRGMVFDG